MPRKLVEKPHANNTWSRARFFSFIRSNLRLLSRKWPPLHAAKLDARRDSQSANKRLKYEYQCAQCKEWFAGKYVQVDHIVACGSLKCWEDLTPFVQRLLCEKEGFRVLCVECHKKRTNNDRLR